MPEADRTFSLTETRKYAHLAKPEVSFYGQFMPDSVTWITVRGGWSYEKSQTSTDYQHHWLRLSFTYNFDAKGGKNKKGK